MKTTPHGSGFILPQGFSRRAETGYVIQESRLGCPNLWGGLFADGFNYTASAAPHVVPFGAYWKNDPAFGADTTWTSGGAIVSASGSGGNLYLGCSTLPNNLPNQGAYLRLEYSSGPFFNPGNELSPTILYSPGTTTNYSVILAYASDSDTNKSNRHFNCALLKNGFTQASGSITGLSQFPAAFSANFPVNIAIKCIYAGGSMQVLGYFAFSGSILSLDDHNNVLFGTNNGGANGAAGAQNTLSFVDNSPIITGVPSIGGAGDHRASYFIGTAH